MIRYCVCAHPKKDHRYVKGDRLRQMKAHRAECTWEGCPCPHYFEHKEN